MAGMLHPAAAKVIATLNNEWDGLRRHRDLPFLDLDNNGAERALRTPVIGRKNFYGSGAAWAAHLAAGIWTITATAAQNDTEPLHLLTDYLTACAENGGKPLTGGKLDPFLPGPPQDAPAAPPAARMTPRRPVNRAAPAQTRQPPHQAQRSDADGRSRVPTGSPITYNRSGVVQHKDGLSN